ncbi:MAG: hypothetical protein ACKVKF_11720 [Rhodobacterales bacterium]
MKRIFRAILICEVLCATHLETVGDLWAASAAQRLGKLSENSLRTEKEPVMGWMDWCLIGVLLVLLILGIMLGLSLVRDALRWFS